METPLRALFPVPWFGDATIDHADPLNRSISVWFGCVAEPTLPTAHDWVADTKEASESSPAAAGFPVPRLNEPHVAVLAWLTPPPSTAEGTLQTASSAATSPNADR